MFFMCYLEEKGLARLLTGYAFIYFYLKFRRIILINNIFICPQNSGTSQGRTPAITCHHTQPCWIMGNHNSKNSHGSTGTTSSELFCKENENKKWLFLCLWLHTFFLVIKLHNRLLRLFSLLRVERNAQTVSMGNKPFYPQNKEQERVSEVFITLWCRKASAFSDDVRTVVSYSTALQKNKMQKTFMEDKQKLNPLENLLHCWL